MSEKKKLIKTYIEEAIREEPNADNRRIKALVESRAGRKTTTTWVKTIRKRMKIASTPTKIRVTTPPAKDEKGDSILRPPRMLDSKDKILDLAGEDLTEEELQELLERGQKEGEDIKPEDLEMLLEFTQEEVEDFISLPLEMLADRTGYKSFAFTAKEKKRIGKPLKKILDFYLPQAINKYFVFLYLGWTTVVIVGSKFMGYRAWKTEQEGKKSG